MTQPTQTALETPSDTKPSASNGPALLRQIPTYAPIMSCEDNLSFMNRLPSDSMQLIVTSPPYNIGKSYEKRTSLDKYLEEQETVISECARLLKPQGSICWQVGNYVQQGEVVPLDSALYPIFKKHKLKLRNRIVWNFGHGLHCTNPCIKSNNYPAKIRFILKLKL